MNSWQEIWSRRAVAVKRFDLPDLLRLDGYDKGAGMIAPTVWRAYVARRAKELSLGTGRAVFEVGCGAGAFLWVLREQGCVVSGLDYSAALIAAAAQSMPDGVWRVGQADEPLGTGLYDVVVAQSVFHYFPTEEYAQRVVRHMVQAATSAVGILDVPDGRLAARAEAQRRAALGGEEYGRRYAGLQHLMLTPAWFKANVPLGWAISIQPQDIAGYGNNPYRFNVILKRES